MLHHSTTSGRYAVRFARYDDSAAGLLSRREQIEYSALTSDDRRRDWLAGRCAAKHAVSRMFVGLHPRDVELVSRPGAPPVCTASPAPSTRHPVPVSIGHCDGIAIAAAADASLRVGVDIERAGAVNPRHAHYFISSRESHAAAVLGFTVVWALKEAAWKALALGDATAFHDLELCVASDGRLCGVLFAGAWLAAHARTWTHSSRLVAAMVCIPQAVQ